MRKLYKKLLGHLKVPWTLTVLYEYRQPLRLSYSSFTVPTSHLLAGRPPEPGIFAVAQVLRRCCCCSSTTSPAHRGESPPATHSRITPPTALTCRASALASGIGFRHCLPACGTQLAGSAGHSCSLSEVTAVLAWECEVNRATYLPTFKRFIAGCAV